MVDAELDRFKSDISLLRYAIERYGYRRDRRKSSRSSHVLRHATTDDKIIVRRNPDGHWTYFSVRDDRDHGTIVDFVKQRTHPSSLGHVRQELRQWLGTPRPERDDWTAADAIGLAVAAHDPRAATEAFAAARVVETSHYLQTRGLRRETLSCERFIGTWRLGARGNVLFPHRDDAGVLTGFEIKNRGFTGFSPGGTKTAWQSARQPDDRVLVITESAIDALSYYQLGGDEARGHRYLSTAGAPSGRQFALLERLFTHLPLGSTVVAAVDRDAAGTQLAEKLERLAGRHVHLSFRRDSPETDKDWNDVLQRTLRGNGFAAASHRPP
jgi:hypothetical protein